MTEIHCTESYHDPWASPTAEGWRAYYPGAFDGPEVLEGSEAAPLRPTGVLRIAGVLLVIIALLAYLVVPVGTFTRARIGGRQPNRVRPIPAAPEHKSVRLRV
jgi:hypothetical protein